MPLRAGQSLGPYEIVEPLGAGGMGEVYKARDSRLDRIVAIKILPVGKTGDAQRARFFQEARAASALNHPHIVTIYDIGGEGDNDYIVMEYVAGKTLGQSIPRKGMRLDEALRVAAQIADALAAAHAAGIIHRDLKPGNVMLAANGSVKVLDFGLAKLAESRVAAADTETRTISEGKPHTGEGVVLGTVGYMSPEQAQSQPVDSRSDIFSFGALFYEMLTGARAFHGDSTLSTLSAVLRDDPRPLRQAAEGTPSEVERVVNRCLRKDPSKRFQHTGDLKVALEELKQESDSGSLGTSGVSAAPRRGRQPIWIAIALLILLGAGAGWWLHKPGAEAPQDVVSATPLTSFPGLQTHPSFSTDGNQVAFVWQKEGETEQQIYVKLVGPGDPIRISKSGPNNICPEWSPDGGSIAFVSLPTPRQSFLVTAPALGGPQRVVGDRSPSWMDTQINSCPSWSLDGQWLFFSRGSPNQGSSIWVVSVATGAAHKVTTPETAPAGDASPALSPDGHTLAFARLRSSIGRIYLQSLSTAMQPEGDSRPITVEDQRLRRIAWMPDGTELVYAAGSTGATSSLFRVRASGGEARRVAGIDVGTDPAISRPRGQSQLSRLAFARTIYDSNVWRLPMSSGKPGTPEQLPGSTRRDFEPRYSPDGARFAFTSDRSGYSEVWAANADGSAQAQLTNMRGVTTGGGRWSPDGRLIVFNSNASGTTQLYMVDPNGGAARRLTNDQSHDTAPSWSRDGKWIYFASNRTGRFEVWKVAPEPNSTPVQVSTHGGYAALESWDGKTVYFSKENQGPQIVSMPVSGGEETPLAITAGTWGEWDVTPEGIAFIPFGVRQVCFYSFAAKQTRTLAELPHNSDFGLTVSPRDGSILYTMVDHSSSELELIEHFR